MADMTPEERRQMRDVLQEKWHRGDDPHLRMTEDEVERRRKARRQDDHDGPGSGGRTLGG